MTHLAIMNSQRKIHEPNQISIKISNYKCFKFETGFEKLKKVNIIIGKNNSGKSSLLDLIEKITNEHHKFEQSTWRENIEPEIFFSAKINKYTIEKIFPKDIHGGLIGINHREYGYFYEGKTIKWKTVVQNISSSFVSCENFEPNPPIQCTEYFNQLTNYLLKDIQDKKFKRLFAERDITPEMSSIGIEIKSNGNGITNAIQLFINKSSLPSKLIESDLLEALNEIFAHDAEFTDIVCQLHDDNKWEIYLEEKKKGRIPLSKSGSGLKTIISVLSYLILIPKLEGRSLSDYIFGFEELENNIHPALLRRLNNYIYKISKEKEFIYFLTTHSNVLIDQFSKQEDAQIIHVTHSNGVSTCNTVTTYIENCGILDDLDVRASDLLQSNGVIWVEGPSDRIYLNRWISLWSEGKFSEGSNYQIIFYGGRLLSHLSAENYDASNPNISILNTNRNAIILIDSDKRSRQSSINQTKKRIHEEFKKCNSLCWITKGKEIENYIPKEVVNSHLKSSETKDVGKYESFFDYLDLIENGTGKKFFQKKSLLAENLVPHMTKENLSRMLDLDEQMKKICKEIEKWNS